MLQSITLEDVLNNTNIINISIEDINIEDTLLDYNNSIIEYMELENAITTIDAAIKIKGNELNKDYILQLEDTKNNFITKLKDVIKQMVDAIIRFLQQIMAGIQDKIYDKTFNSLKATITDKSVGDYIESNDMLKNIKVNVHTVKMVPNTFLDKIKDMATAVKDIGAQVLVDIKKAIESELNMINYKDAAVDGNKYEELLSKLERILKSLDIPLNDSNNLDYSEYKKQIYQRIYYQDGKSDKVELTLSDVIKENKNMYGNIRSYEDILSSNGAYNKDFRDLRHEIDSNLSMIRPLLNAIPAIVDLKSAKDYELNYVNKLFKLIFITIKAMQNFLSVSWNIYYNTRQDLFKVANAIIKNSK